MNPSLRRLTGFVFALVVVGVFWTLLAVWLDLWMQTRDVMACTFRDTDACNRLEWQDASDRANPSP